MSEYLDTLLADKETIILRARQHWVALIRFALQPLLILGAAILLLMVGTRMGGDFLGGIFDTLVGLVTLGLFILAAVWLPIQFVRWTTRRYALTDRRVLYVDGLMRKRTVDAGLDKITDVGFQQSWLGGKLGFGDLAVVTAAGTPIRFEELVGANEFKKAVMTQQEALIHERAGGTASAITSALGTMDGQAAIANLAASGAAAAAPSVTDTTDTLARLAELRDSGAITAEEYDAKKQELLDRL